MIATLPFLLQGFPQAIQACPTGGCRQNSTACPDRGPPREPRSFPVQTGGARELAGVNTVPEAGNISTIICEIAAKHFPKETQSSDKIVRWQQPHMQEGTRDMWKAWRHYRNSTKDTTLRAIIGRWRTWTRYNQLYTKHKERCRTEQMCIAERAAQSHNQHLLYQVVRTLAPKARRSRPQLRDANGQMMTRSEEATCFHQHFATKFTATIDALMKLDEPGVQSTNAEEAPEGPLLHPSALEQHLNKAPLRKAVPQGHPPSAIWRLGSDITAAQVCKVLDSRWCQRVHEAEGQPQFRLQDKHVFLLKQRLPQAMLEAFAMGKCYGIAWGQGNKVVALQWMLEQTGGLQFRQFSLSTERKRPVASSAMGATSTEDDQDAGWDFILEHGERDRSQLKQLRWIHRHINKDGCPMLVQRALDSLANDNCLAKLITRYDLTIKDLHPTFLDNIFQDAIGFLLDHSLWLMGEPGVGKAPLARVTAMMFSRYHGGDGHFRTPEDFDFFRGLHFNKSTPALYDDGDVSLEPIKKKKHFLMSATTRVSSSRDGQPQSSSKANSVSSSTTPMPTWRLPTHRPLPSLTMSS